MGDGNTATTNELLPLCNLPDADIEVCDDGTQLEGILVNNTDAVIDGLETACNPFEICPAGTALEGVTVLDNDEIQLQSHQPVVPEALKYVQQEQTKQDTLYWVTVTLQPLTNYYHSVLFRTQKWKYVLLQQTWQV